MDIVNEAIVPFSAQGFSQTLKFRCALVAMLVASFDASERALVEMHLGDSGDWAPMTRQRGVNPFVEAFHKRENAIAPEEAPWGKPSEPPHLRSPC